MATSYSTNLALTLQGTGDNPGTWGNITNTNLGTLIEQAISGYEVQALTSGTTLTLAITNGASSVARNMYLEFTGDGSTVIVPSNKKLYFVYNNCSSGTITVKVAGQTGVTIPNGSKQILVSNGTDIEQAVSPGIEAPVTTTDNAVVLWDGTDGSAIKNSAVTVNSSGNITTSGDALINNVYIGRRYMGTGGGPDQNLIIGQSAAISLFSLGSQNLNTIVGNGAGNGLTGSGGTGNFNTMFGYGAGGNGGNSSSNTFAGYIAGYNLGGAGNVAVGHASMQGSGPGNTAASNTAVGFQALLSILSGGQNVAMGNAAGDSITSGNWNTVLGSIAGSNITSGEANTLVGFTAGSGITTNTTNTALGDSAYLTGNYSNSTCLGYYAQVDGSNQVQLGNSTTNSYYYNTIQARSDARDKTDIRDTQLGLNFILALRPRDFKWDYREDYRTKPPTPPNLADYPNDNAYNDAIAVWRTEQVAWEEANKLANITHDGTRTRTRYHQGLIAQEVKQTMDAMGVDFGGYQDHTINGGDAVLTIGYDELVAPLIKAIQELKAEFDEYKRTHP
jgi:hypothetical protein